MDSRAKGITILNQESKVVLKRLEKRIKGTRYWGKYGKERLYFNTKTYNDRHCHVKIWLEVVNDNVVFQCKVFHERRNEWEFSAIEERIKYEMSQMYREVIWDCELERKNTPICVRLMDDTQPIQDCRRMPYQEDALRFLCSKKVGALFADVGTGKTKVAIDLAESRFIGGKIEKVLVFCPVSTIQNFKNEVAKFSQTGLIWEYIGIESISSSIAAYNKAASFVDAESMVIIDEIHLVKTPHAKRSKHIHKICQQCSYKLIMTGTPIADSVHDLYMQYNMLSDRIMQCNSWSEYEQQYVLLGGITGRAIVGYKNLDYLTGLIEPYTFQIRKEDCLKLPPKAIYAYTCSLTSKQQRLYSETKEELLEIIDEGDYTSETIFLYLTRLQQIACGYYYNSDGEFTYIGTNKISLLQQIGIPAKAIFFCKYLFEVDILVQHLTPERCSIFTGKNRKNRDAEKEKFVNGQTDYFVATSSSGGTGLNGLQVCNTIFRFSSTYKYIEDKQTIGRIERPGQQHNMTVYNISTDAGIDNMIQRSISRKERLDEQIRSMIDDKIKLRAFLSEL